MLAITSYNEKLKEEKPKKLDVFKTVLEFIKILKWRKDTKCKRIIKQVQQHLMIQKSRRNSIIRQSRCDISQFLRSGHFQKAFLRVEQLYKDTTLLSAYDQLEHFCKCINTNQLHLKNHSDMQNVPSEVSEAISSLLFATSRCGEVPELNLLRNVFKKRYGPDFVKINIELLHGNHVNSQLKQKLCVNSVSDDVKLELISDIAREYTLYLGP